jgi:hypothetical protein
MAGEEFAELPASNSKRTVLGFLAPVLGLKEGVFISLAGHGCFFPHPPRHKQIAKIYECGFHFNNF